MSGAPADRRRGETPVELRQQPSILHFIYKTKDGLIMSDKQILIKDKFCLTIDEASEYFNIGEKKLRQLVSEHLDSGFAIQNGVKVLIKRKRFESFLDDLSSL